MPLLTDENIAVPHPYSDLPQPQASLPLIYPTPLSSYAGNGAVDLYYCEPFLIKTLFAGHYIA